jgi:hypothetical protein
MVLAYGQTALAGKLRASNVSEKIRCAEAAFLKRGLGGDQGLVAEDLVSRNISACIFDEPFSRTGVPWQNACVLCVVLWQG